MDDSNLASNAVVTLPVMLDVSAAHALKELFVDAASSRADVVLSGVNVERVGTPAVQVLLAAAQTIASEGHRFALTQASDALCAAFSDLGLKSTLEQWSNA